jgi:hypothetical protein
MKRTVLIILTVALLLSFATPAHADGDDWQPVIRAVSCMKSERVPTERMRLALNQYIATGDTGIFLAAGWGVGFDGYGKYYHYFGLMCYEVKP